jgi:hypothetical protein
VASSIVLFWSRYSYGIPSFVGLQVPSISRRFGPLELHISRTTPLILHPTLRKPRISKLSHQFAGSIIRREFRRQKNQNNGSVTRFTETPALGYGIRALRHFRSGSVASIGGVVRGARPYCCYPVPGHKHSLIHLTNTTNTHTIDRFQKTGSGKQKKNGDDVALKCGKKLGLLGKIWRELGMRRNKRAIWPAHPHNRTEEAVCRLCSSLSSFNSVSVQATHNSKPHSLALGMKLAELRHPLP